MSGTGAPNNTLNLFVQRDAVGGTKQASTSSSNIAAAPAQGGLILLGAYVVGSDCTQAKDAGDGWVILDAGYDSVNGFGILLAGLLIGNLPSGTMAGLTLPGNAAYTAQTVSFYLAASTAGQCGGAFGFSLVGVCGMRNTGNSYFSDPASDTALTSPALTQRGYAQSFFVSACGYTNNGSNPVETVSAAGGWPELVDVGQNSPPHGLWMGTLPNETARNEQNSTGGRVTAISHTISNASTNRCGISVAIPIVGNLNASAMRRRHLSARRFG